MTSKTTQIAAAGLLALAMPLAQAGPASATSIERHTTLSPVFSQTEAVGRDILVAATRTTALPDDLAAVVRDAVASADAATTDARTALSQANSPDVHTRWNAEGALQDARTALDAASAELRSVTALVDGIDASTTQALRVLQDDIDLLRGAGSALTSD
ncbi:hypothetical protein [Sanguibacter antarcticus]|uniref:Uncharacterized protein n=1 Tax=Sanguibacter antarcticus TaxID=372484 RepID=A0A2A9E6M1_9MICO|nr:hypothetical protein [Sanguibacter antarcticus]PFG34598.1 hypothetical protein ATL42_2515 [Sanguibacter antarcticus]